MRAGTTVCLVYGPWSSLTTTHREESLQEKNTAPWKKVVAHMHYQARAQYTITCRLTYLKGFWTNSTWYWNSVKTAEEQLFLYQERINVKECRYLDKRGSSTGWPRSSCFFAKFNMTFHNFFLFSVILRKCLKIYEAQTTYASLAWPYMLHAYEKLEQSVSWHKADSNEWISKTGWRSIGLFTMRTRQGQHRYIWTLE